MTLPDAASLERLSLAELRGLVGALVGAVRRLQAGNQVLRDEVARLKGLPPRPPSRPSGMERATEPTAAGKGWGRSQRRRGPKRDRGLALGIVGGFRRGQPRFCRRSRRNSCRRAELRRFVLALHAQGQVTTQRLTALPEGIGVEVSKRQVVCLLAASLDDLVAEDQDVLRAGLATARWITVDDTAARHARKDGVTTQLGDDRFNAFRTGASKSRLRLGRTLMPFRLYARAHGGPTHSSPGAPGRTRPVGCLPSISLQQERWRSYGTPNVRSPDREAVIWPSQGPCATVRRRQSEESHEPARCRRRQGCGG